MHDWTANDRSSPFPIDILNDMSTMTAVEEIKAARKSHCCDWCGERIDVGQPYRRWRWFDGSHASTVRAHPECEAAGAELANEEGGMMG